MTDPRKDDLKARLERARDKQAAYDAPKGRLANINRGEMGVGMRVGTEFLGAVIFGLVLGLGIDAVFDSRPIGLVICLLMSVVTAIYNIWRVMKREEAKMAAAKSAKSNSDKTG
jgi:F0F1-type ATP synthase assembly protein I